MKANACGNVRAEQDHEMLDHSFYECRDYQTLFENNDRFIVVGRRGTGKSALTYRLSKDWSQKNVHTIVIAPIEEEVVGLRPLASVFGSTVSRIRMGMKLAWRYALLMEMSDLLYEHYKTKGEISTMPVLSAHIKAWRNKGVTGIQRIRRVLQEALKDVTNSEEAIADLPRTLQLNRLTEDVLSLIEKSDQAFVLLIDRLDEGYEPDETGVGIVDGLIYSVDDLRSVFAARLKALVFIRDNIFRAIQSEDKDFSRNLESQVLRLHWDPQELFYMVTMRIRKAFNIEKESDLKVWNAITSDKIQGRDGFRQCLKLTLYRPRDLIALINTAFYQAQRQRRDTLIEDDFKQSAKEISSIRLDDLRKEYEAVFPGIRQLTAVFANTPSKLSLGQASSFIETVLNDQTLDEGIIQHLRILASPEEAVKALYGVGFLGILNEEYGTFVFSHDGKKPDRTIDKGNTVMVHPCYWSSLNLQSEDMDQAAAEQIFDEYEIAVSSQSVEQRKHLLGQLIAEVRLIPMGDEGASAFEEWCQRVFEIVFAKNLFNVQLKPNGNASQRRDIVATNQGLTGFWKRILNDYKTRLVVFEIKNYQKIGADEYRQVFGYLGKEYGEMGFIVCRDEQAGLVKGAELDAFREFYNKDRVILKLTASTLTNILSKLRSPDKVDVPSHILGRSLDAHITLYAVGQKDKKNSKN